MLLGLSEYKLTHVYARNIHTLSNTDNGFNINLTNLTYIGKLFLFLIRQLNILKYLNDLLYFTMPLAL